MKKTMPLTMAALIGLSASVLAHADGVPLP